MCVCVCRDVCVFVYAAVSNGKWKPRRFSSIHLLFAHRTNGSLSFVHLLTKKQALYIHTDFTYQH
jgi:hypothetical protein